MFLRFRYDQIANFAGNLSVCLASGVDLPRAIRTSSGALAKSAPEFRVVWDRVDQGESLADALRTVERNLPPFVIPVIQCGEQTGRLDQALQFLADHCRMLQRPSESIRNVWLFPLAIFLGGKVMIVVLIFFFGTWSSLTSAVGDLVATCGSMTALAIIFIATPIKLLWDQAKLMLPVIGAVERELAVNRFLHVFSMLYGSGGQRVEKMIRHACQTISNEWLRRDLLRAAVQIERGATLPEAFSTTTTLTKDEQSELAAGEMAGRLAETCSRVAERVGESAATKLGWITQVSVRITMGAVVMAILGAIVPILLMRALQ
jgi:type II secretory pathway component PulF